jgi:hypothetical protein
MKFLDNLFHHKHDSQASFSSISGYDDVNNIINRVLSSEENFNLLLVGDDEDKEYFATTGEFELTASKTNINFKERLDGHPTQIWTGNGYHWIQPQLAIILEEPPMFKKFKEPSRTFLHFEEQLLSGGKADPNHQEYFFRQYVVAGSWEP